MEVDDEDDERWLPSLPMEVWVGIFSFLSGPSLFRCEGVCRAWRQEVRNLVATGKLQRRGLRLGRLSKQSGAVTEHKRRIWHSLSLMVDRRIVLVGVGVYYPSGLTTICVDARPLTEPLRPIDVATGEAQKSRFNLCSSRTFGGRSCSIFPGRLGKVRCGRVGGQEERTKSRHMGSTSHSGRQCARVG